MNIDDLKLKVLDSKGALHSGKLKNLSQDEIEWINDTTNFLVNDPNLATRIKIILDGITEHPLCPTCNSPLPFQKGKEYISKFCSLKCARQIPHNKGKKVTDPQILENIRIGKEKREEKYRNGELIRSRTGKHWDEEHKQHLSQKTKEYAKENPEEMSLRAQKAHETKKSNGYTTSGMKGKKHTKETKAKILESLSTYIEQRKQETHEKYTIKIEENNLVLLNIQNNVLYLKCNKCKCEFSRTRQVFQESKIKEVVCPNCRLDNQPFLKRSKQEKEIYDWIISLNQFQQVFYSNRTIIQPMELDIVIEDKKLAIEFCGSYWHSENMGGKDRMYHRLKFDLCKEKGYKLITVFDDEWKNNPELVKHKILSQLGLIKEKIYARKCILKELTNGEEKEFLNTNHIGGYTRSNIKLGLFYNNQLVYVMTFKKGNISRKSTDWEVQRMAGLYTHNVIGAASKLFKYFVNKYNPEKVISFADLRWSDGSANQNLGFTLEKHTEPNYWYLILGEYKRYYRFYLRKNSDDNPSLTEWENRQLQGYDRIWDCGHAKWVWVK